MQLSDYYFVKCFEKQSFRDTFNSGELFFGHVRKYWTAKNAFQQDFECRILQQEGNGLFIAAKPGFESVLKQAHSAQEVEEKAKERGDIVVARTTSFTSWINGYICCFYLLPQRDVSLRKNKMVFSNDTTRKGLMDFLTNYKREKGAVFAGIYDAEMLCNVVEEACTNRGVLFTHKMVKYADMETTQIFSHFNRGDITPIIFTKPKLYSYQKEYRMFISPAVEDITEEYWLKGVSVSSCIVASFEFPSQLERQSVVNVTA